MRREQLPLFPQFENAATIVPFLVIIAYVALM